MPFLMRRRRRLVAAAVGPALEALDRALDQAEAAGQEHAHAVDELHHVLGDPHP